MKSYLMRCPEELFDEIQKVAKRKQRSVNGQIVWILRQAVDQAEQEELVKAQTGNNLDRAEQGEQ